MVAIKIQSSADIIRAYLQNLGFSGKLLEVATGEMLKKWEAPSQKQEISIFLDKLILEKAKKAFPESPLKDEQLIAQYKFGFLISASKDKYRDFNFGDDIRIFCSEEQAKMFAPAPGYSFAEMKPQKIESPYGFIRKIFHKRKKD